VFPVRYDVVIVGFFFNLVPGFKGYIFILVLNILYILLLHLYEIIVIVYLVFEL
jgi:hypothetical protein